MPYLKSAKKIINSITAVSSIWAYGPKSECLVRYHSVPLYEEKLVSVISADQKSKKIEKRERLGRLP